MRHKAHDEVKFLRKTIDIHPDLVETIEEMGKPKNWSFSYMCYVLLQQAVKEKTRKRKSAEESNS